MQNVLPIICDSTLSNPCYYILLLTAPTVEYIIICLSTFALILVTGVEYGIVLGVVLYIGCKKRGLDVGNIDSEEEEDQATEYSHPVDTAPLNRSDGGGGSYGAITN